MNTEGSTGSKKAWWGGVVVDPSRFVSEKKGRVTETYEIIDNLGEGAFGVVKLVKHRISGDHRAMKVINKRMSRTAETDLYNELNILKSLVLYIEYISYYIYIYI